MRAWLLILSLAALPALHGCLPVIATGMGTGVLMAEDRRTVGTITEDEGIELKARQRLTEKYGDQLHVSITSYNRLVLLTGEVPSAAAKSDIEKRVRAIENVRGVTDELTVAGNSALSSRANDAFITSKVKARFLDVGKFQANHVKVVTENNTVYLLGLVKRKEADDAVQIARTTSGVQRVVKVFEYLD
jgi:osmotically-inducible protein OsmY